MATVNNNVWELGEKYKAAHYAKSILPPMFQSKLFEVKELTKVCQQMSVSYEDVIDEQNEYLIEIEDINADINELKKDLEEEIKNKEEEINKLLAKPEGEELTAEEKAEINALYDDINGLTAEVNASIETKNSEIKTNSKKASNVRTKEVIAEDYGDRTFELGTELAGTEVKGGFFRKLFGRTKSLRKKKEAGEAAVKVSDELLSKLDNSRAIDKEITKKSKVSKSFLSC